MTNVTMGSLTAFPNLNYRAFFFFFKNGNNLLDMCILIQTIALSLPLPPQALLKLPSHLSQSEEVLKFFETTLEDLNPPTE